jgi:hypothetical protein
VDIVKILEDAVTSLPEGDYSIGLNAIVRHVKAAIRHLERDQKKDPDTCTDAIYRTNQAYEGSLKEAYRVLAGQDPSTSTPFQIEQYLETHNVVRPRVLTQLTRYRQDYRNPSTHDYKLDFDEDEALLAIVSVCAFAKLLTNQIASKLASEAAQLIARPAKKIPSRATLRSQGRKISSIALAYTSASAEVDWFEFESGLADALNQAGLSATVHDIVKEEVFFEVTVEKGRSMFGIDTRMSRHDRTGGQLVNLSTLASVVEREPIVGALSIIRKRGATEYDLYRGSVAGKPVYLIMYDDPEQHAANESWLGSLTKI